MTERRSIIWLKDLNDCDLPAEIQGNPGLKHMITYLRGISQQEVNAWKEEIRQSRLHDWEDDDDEVVVAPDVHDEQADTGNSSIEEHDEQ